MSDGNRAGRSGPRDSGYILIVDDDPGVHALLGLTLRPLHLDVRYALSGYKALEIVGAHRPALIVLDLMMPGFDGFDVLEHLGKDEETATIPVIIFSANLAPAQANGYQWPSQVVNTLEKSNVRPSEFREAVRAQLVCA